MEYVKALGIVIAAVVLVYKLLEMFVAKIGGMDTLTKAYELISKAVQAIEQTVDAPGETKKEQALELIEILLAEAGITLEPTIIDLFLEAAVFAMNLILKTNQTK